jgi:hypothetical protein
MYRTWRECPLCPIFAKALLPIAAVAAVWKQATQLRHKVVNSSVTAESSLLHLISGYRRGVNEIFPLTGCYAA